MGNVWSRQARFEKWLQAEMAVLEARTDLKQIPKKVYKAIVSTAGFDIEAIDAEEAKTNHEMVAFLNVLFNNIGDANSRYVHYGLTSSDIMDTGMNLQLIEASNIIQEDIAALMSVLKRLIGAHKYTPIIGRTHGIHAEPTTFGLKLAIWYTEMTRNIKRFKTAVEGIRIGKFSGAVGNYSMIDPDVEVLACEKLGLSHAPISSQIVQRDRYAFYISILGVMASTLEKMAVELRHLARTEVGEIEEPFSAKQKGSSAMPHKRNPITLERISGLARLIRSYSIPAMENISLWHERDLSHSSVERIIIPDATILTDYILYMMTYILDNMTINTKRMRENIDMTRGLVFSQRLMLRLVNAGMPRTHAHTMVQGKIMSAIKKKIDFYELVRKDGELRNYITLEEIDALFDLDIYYRNVDYILERVFADENTESK